MDNKMKLILILLIIPLFVSAQNSASKKYIDSSELQLKYFATQVYYAEQISITDTSSSIRSVDYFLTKYFQETNYTQKAIEFVLAFSKKEAQIDFYTEERGKCVCFSSSLQFFHSDKLNKKIKELKRYLTR